MTNANDYLSASNGTENLYCHPLSNYVYTDGIKELVEKCQAYWLVDLLISHQCNQRVYAESFQVWSLKRCNGSSFMIVATDGNNNEIARQPIEYSDFPYDKATLWLVDETLLLPDEY